MSEITASKVKELRDLTGLGMMECKKALQEAKGDIEEAENLLRVKSGSKASKVAGRVAAEGAVGVNISSDKKIGALVEINCETDFVGKDESFKDFVAEVAQLVVENQINEISSLGEVDVNGESLEAIRQRLVMRLGENITWRRVALVKAKGALNYYVHGGRIGVLVDIEGGDNELQKDLAMHIAAMKPVAVSSDGIAQDLIDREGQIARDRALESGKNPDIVDKIVEGTIKKYLSDVTLLGQSFVKNDKQSVGQLVKSKNAKVHGFNLFIVGEGIEKKSADFVAEVKAQASKMQ